jgi:hypothetical protein
MRLSEDHAHKFGAYTLLCHSLLQRLDELSEVIEEEGFLSLNACVEMFDSSLKQMFTSRANSVAHAVGVAGGHLHAHAEGIKTDNPKVAAIFEEVIHSAAGRAGGWTYQSSLNDLHEQGRLMAKQFFGTSPHGVTAARLGMSASVICEFGEPNVRLIRRLLEDGELPYDIREGLEDRLLKLESRTRYSYRGRSATIYTYEGRTTDEFVILVPFDYSHNFFLYVSYPYLFMHEYTAHIFSTDHRNTRFNDGWMLHAASEFLIREWSGGTSLSFLSRGQAYAFRRYLRARLEDEPKAAVDFSEEFLDWLITWDVLKFEEITYELAAYQPVSGQNKAWPAFVIKRLSRQFRQSKETLEARMKGAADLEALYPGLKYEKF